MNKPKICVSIIDNDPGSIAGSEAQIDLFELRLDILGEDWRSLYKIFNKPWIACNRSRSEGGRGDLNTEKRIETLLRAGKAGASIIDIEFSTGSLADKVKLVKKYSQCLISFHDLKTTPSLPKLTKIVEDQILAGADICKVVTTATKFEDNATILRLISQFPDVKMVAFAMGEAGRTSRLLSPLCGGYFTYACMEKDRQAAPGQISVKEMREIYGCLKR